MQNTWKK